MAALLASGVDACLSLPASSVQLVIQQYSHLNALSTLKSVDIYYNNSEPLSAVNHKARYPFQTYIIG
jgi:hypothetical protein